MLYHTLRPPYSRCKNVAAAKAALLCWLGNELKSLP